MLKNFFKKNLPEKIKKAIDFSSLELKKDSFIDDNLKLQVADLLYSVKFNGQQGFLYVLLEHASKPDPLLPFRMLKYMIAIMDNHLKTKKSRTLPLIYPIILYTGEKPYTYSMDLFDLFLKEEKELAKEALTAPYHLIDLTQVSDEELKKYLWFGTAALTLKHIHDSNIIPFFESILDMLRELEKQGEERYIYTVITYMAGVGETPDKNEFFETTKKLKSINEEKIMSTLVDYLQPELLKIAREQALEKARAQVRAEALEEGLEKGRKERAIEIAKTLLSKGINIKTIAESTKFSEKEIRKLLS